jgi:serine phosphatase RsbU (regulator of sigma subunit)
MNMIPKTANTQTSTRKSPANCLGWQTSSALPGQASRKSRTARTGEPPAITQSQKKDLDAVRSAHAKLQQAIYEAAQVQRRLCAPRECVWGDFEIAGESFPVRHLTGDFFKVMELGSALGLALGDIAGKGLSAGIWQAHLIDLVQRYARACPDPADAVAAINRELCQDLGEPPLTALFFARLDPERNELVYCNAGLPPPLLLRRNKSVERLEQGGPMLGALQGATYNFGSLRLNPGDMLLTYSDGLTECRNSKDQEFEIGGLSAAAMELNGLPANRVLFSTLATVLDFAEACPPEDDLTLLVVRRREASLAEDTPGSKDVSSSRKRVISATRPGGSETNGKASRIAERI